LLPLLKYVGFLLCLFPSVYRCQPVFWKSIDTLKNESVFSIALNSKGWIFTGSWLGKISFSSDKGETWTVKEIGDISSLIYSLAVNKNDHIFAGTIGGGLLRSTDDGETWSDCGLNDYSVVSLTVTSNNHIFAGTGGRLNSIFKSTDNGDRWIECSIGIVNTSIHTLAADSADIIIAGTLDGIFISTDNGISWVEKNNGFTNTPVSSIIIDSHNFIYAGTFHEGDIFFSSNMGESWSIKINPLNNSFIRSFAIDKNGAIYTGSYDGVFRSDDLGENWMQLNNGLHTNMVQSLAADKEGDIYAGTWGSGAYKNLNTLTSVEDAARIPVDFYLGQNYPNPFNPITKIRYSVPVSSFVVIKLYDILGNEIAVLVNENKLPGNYELDLNSEEYRLSSGVYFYSMLADKFAVTKKLILLK
jgi:ligand-binding sensor domain-containing protein